MRTIDADSRNEAQFTMSYDNWVSYWNAVILTCHVKFSDEDIQQKMKELERERMNYCNGIVFW